ncbi:uncharacterized protein [Lepeophtheirus salmonis]|uniref:uncharacterized protein n=1 Tax=Lepeophtheirus salmonis TaxID=72036 RepID=UPI001AE6B7C2|nr:uncharacterized protein LOC121124464 [Lepeophtheirus salmonis]
MLKEILKEESVLRQWEQMHRPPDTIPTSGPVYRTSQSRAGLIVPLNRTGRKGSTRRHSVISSGRDVSAFPLKAGASPKDIRVIQHSVDTRRPSEVWMGKAMRL